MNVESADLENHLDEYLLRVRTTGEVITVCQANEPVAVLSPVKPPSMQNGDNLIEQLLLSPWPVKDFVPLTRAQIYERE
jgi:prevent-host-death family protein